MKRLIPATALILATSISLPALGATNPVLRDSSAPIETVQYRHTPEQNQRHQYHGSYNAYGSANHAPAPSGNHDAARGWPCINRDIGDASYSAFPAWEQCN